MNVTKLGEFLELSAEDINRLALTLSGPPPKEKRSVRKKIDYADLKKQYEQLHALT